MTMPARHLQSGFSIVELMIALTIGLLVAAAAAAVFVQGKMNYLQNEQLGRVQENGRFALKLLQRDLSMAGFMGEIAPTAVPGSVTVDNAGIGTACGNASSLAFAPVINSPIAELVDGTVANAVTNAFPCIANSEYLAGTDAVMIKRVSDNPECSMIAGAAGCGSEANRIYLLTNGVIGRLHLGAGLATPAAAPPLPRADWRYFVYVYFIRPYSVNAGDGVPTLCRKELNGGNPNTLATECLVEGIEDLQVQFGIDAGNDRIPDFYSDSPTAAQIERVRSAKIYVLARSVDTLPNTVNDKTYRYAGVQRNFNNDRYLRRVYSSSAQIRNRR